MPKLGIDIELRGDEKYKQALKEIKESNKVLASEMKLLQAEYKGNENSIDYLNKKGDLLQRQLLEQRDKVKSLTEAMTWAKKEYGESSSKAKDYETQLNYAKIAEINLQRSIEDNNKALEGQGQEMVGLGDTVDQLASKLGINLPQGATKALNGMKGLSAGTVAAMAAAAAGIAAVIKIVKELGELTLSVAADVDEYLAQEQITGVPAQMLQAWDYAAPLIDVDASTITSSMTKLVKAMGDAAGGSESTQAKFRELGVSIYDANGELRNSEEVFYEVIDALGEIQNPTERDAAAMEILGKSAQDLNPLINQGSDALKDFAAEAEAVGYILNEDQLEALGAVDDAYQELQLTIEATKKQLAAEFAPAAEEAMTLFTDVVSKAGKMLIDSGIIDSLTQIITLLIEIFKTAGEIIGSIPGFNNSLGLLQSALQGVAGLCALIADAANVIAGIFTLDFERIGVALGYGKNSGNFSNMQKWMGYTTEGQSYNEATGQWSGNYGLTATVDPKNMWVGEFDRNAYGYNASGTDNWRGGLTWVGESGPELVALPQGSQVYNAQDSANMIGGDTFYISIDAKNVKEFNDIVELAKSARVRSRMR